MRRSLVVSLLAIVAVAVVALSATVLTGSSPALGLDLQGGVSVVLRPEGEASSEALDQSISIIRNRVDAIGVAEPEITRQGDAIVVQLPGVNDQQRALDLVGQTAELQFRPVLAVYPPGNDSSTDTTDTTAAGDTSTTAVPTTVAPAETTAPTQAATGTTAPSDAATPTTAASDSATTTTTAPVDVPPLTPREQNTPDATVIVAQVKDGTEVARYELGPVPVGADGQPLTGSALSTAKAEFPNQWVVNVVFTDEGIDDFNAVAATCSPPSETCPTGQLAIVLDDNVVSAPVIQTDSFSKDQVQISGNFTEGDAKDLALVLRFGALPVKLVPERTETVSATLGEDSLRAALIAGGIGIVLLVTYLLLYYRFLGLVIPMGLAVWGALLYSIITWLSVNQGLALTLAGATGIIVSIGVTVDSYIVYFERLKDEMRAGRSLRLAVDRGFKSAFRTILAADTASLIGAFLLWYLTVGSVRGFAFFLGLSTVLDIAISYFFTRPMVALMAMRRSGKGGALGERTAAPPPASRPTVGARA